MTIVVQVARRAGTRIKSHSSMLLIAVMIPAVSMLMITHALEVLVWSLAYSLVEASPADASLVYFAFVNYTTLGGLQMQTDLAISPAGDVWVMNNWQDIDSCLSVPEEALSTRCGGQGVVIFFGMAKPVRSPQIGPARALQ